MSCSKRSRDAVGTLFEQLVEYRDFNLDLAGYALRVNAVLSLQEQRETALVVHAKILYGTYLELISKNLINNLIQFIIGKDDQLSDTLSDPEISVEIPDETGTVPP